LVKRGVAVEQIEGGVEIFTIEEGDEDDK